MAVRVDAPTPIFAAPASWTIRLSLYMNFTQALQRPLRELYTSFTWALQAILHELYTQVYTNFTRTLHGRLYTNFTWTLHGHLKEMFSHFTPALHELYMSFTSHITWLLHDRLYTKFTWTLHGLALHELYIPGGPRCKPEKKRKRQQLRERESNPDC